MIDHVRRGRSAPRLCMEYGLVVLFSIILPLQGATASDRVVPSPLQCDFNDWEGGQRFERLSSNVRSAYDLGMNLSFFGNRATHETLRAAFPALRFNPTRAPIVMADLDSGRLHVFDCQSARCTRAEIARDAPLACMAALGARSCRTFAVRVERQYFCTLMPGLNQ